ncbi:MAG TPA: hypothetical protein DCS55_07705 [Acidimicrobiaceae bacterium]|nr:hypothetical protein [Acidimicrobiaceae bacterium]
MELRVGDGEVAARLDCRADVEPGATVADLRGALAAHAADRGIEVPPDARLWADDGTALDEAAPVVRAGVTSGQRVWLRAAAPPTEPSDHRPDRHDRVDRVDGSGTVPFNRTPYRPVRVQPRRLPPLPAPPSPPPANRIAITSFVIPLASGVGFAVVFGRPQFLLIALLAPIALGAVTLFERRRGRRSHRTARAEHQALLEVRLGDIERAKEDERAERDRALPPLEALVEQARTRAPSLWARDRGAPDLLVLRAGRSTLPSLVSLEIERGGAGSGGGGGDEQLRREAEARIAEAVAEVHDVPVAIDLERAGIVGLHGDPDLVDGLARSLLAQTVVRHGPEDVILVGLLAPSALAGYEWLRWLPHVRSAASPLSVPHLAAWPEDVDVVLGALLDVAADRRGTAGRDRPRLVVAVHEDAAVDRTALGRLLDDGPGAGIRVLWIGRDEALLPRQCRLVASVASGDRTSVLAATDPDAEPATFTVEVAGTAAADALARDLAPLRDVTSVAQVGALPRMVGLTDVLEVVTAEQVADGWYRSTSRSLAAPVGVGAGGTFSLDLVEQGPHMLIAGTSGAGKSELLQSMVAAMAAQHPPERLTFLFIDYKGGAAAAPFAELPHNVGVVTNLDARLSLRALASLRAELDRRMAILAEAGVADLAQLDPDRAPPRLVIVVDEFATLVKEIPDFVAGVVDVAQRGRSLGIHLVLATQRPAGAVNENILANTNLRVALRVVDAADSQSVIGSPAAAEIPVPLRGRAFARTGPTELVPFQAAWSGAPRHHGGGARVRVAPLGVGRVPDAAAPVALGGTQLEQVLASIGVAHQRRGGAVPRRPWLPPLPDVVDLHDLLETRGLVLGLHDDPEHQARRPAVVDLEAEGGLAVFGAGGSGRTTALRTAVASLVAAATPDEVEVVAFDFASRALLPLLELPHTRVVCTADDLDTTAAQIDALAAEVERRRALLGEHRVESLSALRARTGEPVVPRIAVVIDGFGALRAELDTPAGYDWLQRLQRLLVEGRQVGIHPLLSADRRPDLPNALLGAIGARLVLRMTEPDALVSLGVPMALARGADLEPGCGYLRGDEEVQVAVLGPDPSAAAQADAIASLGAETGAGLGERRGSRPGPLPEDVARPTGLDHDLVVALGVTDDAEPVTVDLGPGALLIVGPPGSGRTTAAAAVVAGLRAAGHDPVVIAGRDEDAPARLQSLLDAESPGSPVVIDDADELAEGPGGRALEQLATTRGYRLVATADAAAVARAFSGWVPALKRGRRMLLLQPAGAADIDQLAGVRVKLRPGARFPPGRGVLVVDRHARTIQTGRPEQ